MKHRLIEGRLVYTSRKPGREGEVRGFETFMFTRHSDGKVTLRAHCEIEEPDPAVMRDIIYSLDEHGQPMDLHVRLTVGDAFMGSGWLRFDGHTIECESYGPSIGRVSQRMPVGGAFDGFGTHPIVADAYNARRIDRSLGTHTRKFRCFLPSPDHRGATPPLLAESMMQLGYLGEETVTVAAGTFDCWKFEWTDPHGGMVNANGSHPPYEMWVSADDDALFVQGGVGGYMQTWYELVELNR